MELVAVKTMLYRVFQVWANTLVRMTYMRVSRDGESRTLCVPNSERRNDGGDDVIFSQPVFCTPTATSKRMRAVRTLSRMADTTKYTLSSLPLPPSSHTLTKNLTPDPLVPSPALFRNVQLEKPSIQRRARLLDTAAHFSYCAPYPAAFPYRITPPEDKDDIDQAAFVEKWLAGQEAVHERGTGGSLNKFYPNETALGERTAKLIGLAETGLRDCLPHLDIGDALALLGTPGLVAAAAETQEEPAEENAARSELIDVLSGGAILANVDVDPERAWAPWSLRYSGHQFGTWAGQLGDGRAISVCECTSVGVPKFLS